MKAESWSVKAEKVGQSESESRELVSESRELVSIRVKAEKCSVSE